jgi:hypothetical protein
VDIKWAWKSIRKNIKTSVTHILGYYKLNQHRLWFDKRSKLLDQRKKAKLQRLKNLSQINGDDLNNVKYEANRNFRSKKREYKN